MFQMVTAGGADNVEHVKIYVQAASLRNPANTTAVALDDSFMGTGVSSYRRHF